jgi:transcriptional regulator with XRE-family HTH domain
MSPPRIMPEPQDGSGIRRALGVAMRLVRSGLDLSQEAVARRADVDRSYYGALERGEFNPTIEVIVRVAAGLGLTLGELFKRAGL